MRIFLSELNEDNWLEAANLSVSEKQKDVFPIPNVYWLGISRYEEHTTLYAITLDKTIIGLIVSVLAMMRMEFQDLLIRL